MVSMGSSWATSGIFVSAGRIDDNKDFDDDNDLGIPPIHDSRLTTTIRFGELHLDGAAKLVASRFTIYDSRFAIHGTTLERLLAPWTTTGFLTTTPSTTRFPTTIPDDICCECGVEGVAGPTTERYKGHGAWGSVCICV